MILGIIIFLVGLLFLYLIIEAAVRNGIDGSLIGTYLKEKHGISKEDIKSPLDSPLDQHERINKGSDDT
ncbi:hypothetical protein ACTWQB_13495 [Piscibacillus sp. B03]|uniref:hypothetical protein n=1 Tax=Piscibacillus sp. B03 TaxID=3457430 RepID=UPI003FCE61EB